MGKRWCLTICARFFLHCSFSSENIWVRLPLSKNDNMLASGKYLTMNFHSYSAILNLILERRNTIQVFFTFCWCHSKTFMGLYFNTGIQIGETKVIKSCKVNTLVNTNHFPQNLKKRYRLSLAIVVHQSGRNSHSGDRLFEWPKLSEKQLNDK